MTPREAYHSNKTKGLALTPPDWRRPSGGKQGRHVLVDRPRRMSLDHWPFLYKTGT